MYVEEYGGWDCSPPAKGFIMATGIRRIADQYKWISRGYGQCIVVGTSDNPMNLRKDDQSCIDIYTTNSRTTGTNRSLRINQAQTAYQTAGYNRVLDVVLDSSYGTGGDGAVIRAQCDYTGGGFAHGIMNVLTSEIKLPASSLTRGAAYALELRVNVPTGGSWNSAGPIGFVRVRSAGTGATEIDDHAYFMMFHGHTAGADSMVSLESQTVKCSFSGEAAPTTTVRYLVFSQMQDGLGLGASDNLMDLGVSTTKRAVQLYTTSASVTAATSIRYLYAYHEASAAGSGHRAEFHTKILNGCIVTNWANALKGYIEFGDDTARGNGLNSAICAEMKLPNNAVAAGEYWPLEIELVGQASGGHGHGTGFITCRGSGTMTDVDDYGFLLDVQGMTPLAGQMLAVEAQTLKCRIGTATRYMVLSQIEDGLGLGVDGDRMVLTDATEKAIYIHTTTATTDTSRLCPVMVKYYRTAATVAAGRDWGIMVDMSTTHYWNTASGIYATMNVVAAGCWGRASAVQGELIFADDTIDRGQYSCFDAEIDYSASTAQAGGPCSFLSCVVNGGIAADDGFDDTGYLLQLIGVTEGDDHLWDEAGGDTTCEGTLKIRINDEIRYIMLSSAPL